MAVAAIVRVRVRTPWHLPLHSVHLPHDVNLDRSQCQLVKRFVEIQVWQNIAPAQQPLNLLSHHFQCFRCYTQQEIHSKNRNPNLSFESETFREFRLV